jgi:hypothetical protein
MIAISMAAKRWNVTQVLSSPDRLARVYAYQVIVLDELARRGAPVLLLRSQIHGLITSRPE